MKKAFLFDVGQVIVRFDLSIGLKALMAYTDVSETQIVSFFTSEEERLFTEGLMSGNDFFDSAKRRLGLRLDKERFIEIYAGIFRRDPEIEELIKFLAKDFKLGALSNTNEFHFPFIMDTYEIMQLFDPRILSYEEKCQKPDKRIFEIALKKIGFSAPEVVFIDDTYENIEAAEQIGITSFHYRNAQGLLDDLDSYGIIDRNKLRSL